MGRIVITLDNKTYTLEFSRRTILLANDLKSENDYDKIIGLVKCGLLKNHPDITNEEVENIVDGIGDLDKFLTKLSEVMKESIDALAQSKGNVHWEVK